MCKTAACGSVGGWLVSWRVSAQARLAAAASLATSRAQREDKHVLLRLVARAG